MEEKLFLKQYLIWVMILLLGQLHGYKSCILKERNALLDLKIFLISTTEEGQSEPVLPSWTNDTTSDCCQWERVKCNSTSGRVLKLSTRGLNLKESSLLNLSLLHPFEEVQILDLSESKFGGFFDGVEGYKSLSRLRNLEILDLSSNKFNSSVFHFLNAATSLTTLLLQGNNMNSFYSKKKKKKNNMNSPFPAKELSAMVKLKFLDLSGNGFSGSMELQGICKLKNLQELDISQNNLVGEFPLCLTGLTGLRVIDLSSNQMSGKLPSSLANLESLEYFSLFDNNFEGFFSLDSLANLSMLKVFGVNSRSNSFQVVSEGSWTPKFQLNAIALRSCNLVKVPHFLLHQKDLRQVDLSDNNISGQFPSWLLANNTKLDVLLLRSNYLTSFQLPRSAHNLLFLDLSVNKFNHLLPENIGWILPHLLSLNISDNGFQGSMPSSLGNMKSINNLDISHNSFGGKLPRSFVEGCYSLSVLKLSHNKLSGEVFPESTNFTRVSQLSMDNNHFNGTIGQGLRRLRSLYMLDVSYNNLTGGIPSWIGENQFLGALQLSNNVLEGEIPPSLLNIFSLRLLDLSGNGLSGGLPQEVSFRTPVVLYLQDNNLSGHIPDTLLANVLILDLRNNRLSGNIPDFINTQTTNILLLRGNNLTGCIPRQLCGLSNIHLLDLANNRLNGSIPSCLSNTSLGLGKEDAPYGYSFGVAVVAPGDSTSTDSFSYLSLKMSVYISDPFRMAYLSDTQYDIEFATKHRYDAYRGGILNYLYGLDLSENELTGEIPSELGDLLRLRALNLSHNYLSGVVPATFSGIRNLESLDLSFNRLHGRIPPQLTELNSLAVFNVSYNNLSGAIPQGKQFNTFETLSYLGNLLLCGQPTNTICNNVTSPESDNELVKDDDGQIDMVSFYWSSAATYVTILIGLFASLSFDSLWSRFWFYIVEVFINKGSGAVAPLVAFLT
ncbi:receptor-like protein 15 [Brassica napus]|uniref:receptor-like protein 15 n=1 Tax=Brassica napus TaxID=3708 RepID=UPI0020786D04|nr:receptor-like protein 15 [Brassica napus]